MTAAAASHYHRRSKDVERPFACTIRRSGLLFRSQQRPVVAAVVAAASLLLCAFLSCRGGFDNNMASSPLLATRTRAAATATTTIDTTPPLFSLLVTLQFSDKVHKESFLKQLAPVVTHCRNYEPETVTYQVLQSDQDHNHVLMLERYQDKRSYMETHKQSNAFLAFRAQLQQMQDAGHVTISGHSYVDDVGYVRA